MLVSIITPTFNTGHYLEGTIKCLLEQTHPDVEHIVVDGASTDNTVELLRSYPGIRWISEPDKGMYDAINKGIEIADGDVIAYLNADDRYFSGTLEAVVNAFKTKPNVDFVYGYCTYVDETEQTLATFRTLPFTPSLMIKGRIAFAQPACFWRKSVHSQIGVFDPQMRNSGDADFFRRLLSSGMQGHLIRKPLSTFMVRDGALSASNYENMIKERDLTYQRHNIGARSVSYILNDMLHYMINIDSYARYKFRKYFNHTFRK